MAFDLDSVQRHVPDVHHRSGEFPRDHPANQNPPIGSVGPQSDDGPVMGHWPIQDATVEDYRPVLDAEPWNGWPTGWATPPLEPFGEQAWSGFGYGRQDPAGYHGRIATAANCVDLNTSQLASFPIYGVKGRDIVRLPSWSENPQPELYADWSDFAMALSNSLYMRGDAYVWATMRNADGYPARFIVLNPDWTTCEHTGDGRYRYLLGSEELDPDDICHIRYQVVAHRADGVSPLEWIGRHMVAADALSDYATDIARHGVWAVLEHPANLNAKQRDDLQMNWRLARRSAGSVPAVLSGGVTMRTLSLSPDDMALLDLLTMNEQRICAAFRVPPYLVAVDQPGSLVYQNASALTDHHWRVGLRPVAKKIATALSAWALPHGTRMEFDRDEYVRPGMAERAGYYQTLAGIEQDGQPAMSVDEIRNEERLLRSDLPLVANP